MNQAVVFYNPFLPELKISINGKQISSYSSLKSYRHQRLEVWADRLFNDLYREINSEYEMVCISNDFACEWLEELADKNPYCTSFVCQTLPINASVYERLDKLDMLGCEETTENVLIPVVNVSNSSEMTSAVFEVLEEQGIFEDVSEDGITWTECPLTDVEIKSFNSGDEIPYNAPVVIAVCESEEDDMNLDADALIYALVMGSETRYLGRQGNKVYFSVDPGDIGKIFLGIIEEEALCPLLSQLSYNFPESEKAFLTESEKEDLELVCQASPTCCVSFPQICDVGRAVDLDIRVYPSDTGAAFRLVSDSNDIIDIEDCRLIPRAAGSAEIAVYIGEDPYPAVSETVKVRQRNLIKDIKVFPSALYMPVNGTSEIKLSFVPENAENKDEICWDCDDRSVATVDPVSGVITAVSCGNCNIIVSTQEITRTVSLEVQPEIEDVFCPCNYIELGIGEQKEWKYRIVPENAYGREFLRVISSDKNIAEYRGGYIVGKSMGSCKIYIKDQSGSISRELKVSVKKNGLFS